MQYIQKMESTNNLLAMLYNTLYNKIRRLLANAAAGYFVRRNLDMNSATITLEPIIPFSGTKVEIFLSVSDHRVIISSNNSSVDFSFEDSIHLVDEIIEKFKEFFEKNNLSLDLKQNILDTLEVSRSHGFTFKVWHDGEDDKVYFFACREEDREFISDPIEIKKEINKNLNNRYLLGQSGILGAFESTPDDGFRDFVQPLSPKIICVTVFTQHMIEEVYFEGFIEFLYDFFRNSISFNRMLSEVRAFKDFIEDMPNKYEITRIESSLSGAEINLIAFGCYNLQLRFFLKPTTEGDKPNGLYYAGKDYYFPVRDFVRGVKMLENLEQHHCIKLHGGIMRE